MESFELQVLNKVERVLRRWLLKCLCMCLRWREYRQGEIEADVGCDCRAAGDAVVSGACCAPLYKAFQRTVFV